MIRFIKFSSIRFSGGESMLYSDWMKQFNSTDPAQFSALCLPSVSL